MGRDRNKRGRYADRIDPDTVMDVFTAREDAARPVTATDVVDELGIARRTAHNKLNALVERGTLDTRKVGARGRVWWTPARRETREDAVRADTVDDAGQPPTDPSPDAHGTHTAGEGHVLDAALEDLPGTVDPDAARETILAAREFLRTDGPAPKAAIVRNVMPDHPLGYDADDALEKIDAGERYRGAWWRRVVKPGLEALDDVTKPPTGASDWEVTEDGD